MGIGDIKPETNRLEHTVSATSLGADKDSTARVQNVDSDEVLASKSAEVVKSSIDLVSPDLQLMSSTASSSDDAVSVAEAKVDADVELTKADSSVAAAVGDRDQSTGSTEVQHHDEDYAGSVGSSPTHHGGSVLPKLVYFMYNSNSNTHFTGLFQDNLGKPVPKRENHSGF